MNKLIKFGYQVEEYWSNGKFNSTGSYYTMVKNKTIENGLFLKLEQHRNKISWDLLNLFKHCSTVEEIS